MDDLPPAPTETDPQYECFECGSTIVEGKCPYCSKPALDPLEERISRWHQGDSTAPLHEALGMTQEAYALYVEKPPSNPAPPPSSERGGRQSAWYLAKEELRTVMPVPPFTALIANLTPHRESVRLGVLINGRESSIRVPFELAAQFLDQVRSLIEEKGVR